ncbi:flagellar type III secretion system pore protein FliP [Paraferrimonas sp. SM1919]|uniref:flagellar type III secretion system pore protein FliP n=1 Tax=Paraferrimonas sp. SM1919 TaxID=2662263 RepID=UPI0013D67DBC|nr:flagellar type III secretion system pore protein FliP [Paraferrimonas sp. SM1919]
MPNCKTLLLKLLFAAGLLLAACFESYANELTLFSAKDVDDGQEYTVKLQILILMTVLSLLPVMLMMMTGFTRIIIVLSILRQALGLQQSPPNKVLVGIALILTIMIMRPVWVEVYEKAFVPYQNEQLTLLQAIDVAEQPVRAFMLGQTRETDLEQMLRIAGEPSDTKVEDIPFSVLMPAFVLSELKTAFQIGFLLFIPFLIIDLVVASTLMSMGMMMLSPLIISLPFKLMIFVVVDGWSMTVGTLSASFGV